MATVSQLQEEALRFSSLNTSDATETALALRFLNEANARAVAATGAFTRDVTVSPSAGSDSIAKTDYAPAASVSQGVTTVKNIWLNGSSNSTGTGRPLQRRSIDDVIRYRATDDVAPYDGPLMYAVRGDGTIELWPVTSSGNTFTVETEVLPLELVASGASTGQETTPSSIPLDLHRDILLNFATARLLQYRGLESRAAYFMSEYERGVERLQERLNEQGGIMGPPIRVRRRRDVSPIRYPDQRP